MKKVHWQDEPDDHDYPAATSYLALIADPDTVGVLVEGLKSAPIQHAKAKDILRASGLPDLPLDNVHVAKDVAKVKAGTALSPVLLVRGDIGRGSRCRSRTAITACVPVTTSPRTPTSPIASSGLPDRRGLAGLARPPLHGASAGKIYAPP